MSTREGDGFHHRRGSNRRESGWVVGRETNNRSLIQRWPLNQREEMEFSVASEAPTPRVSFANELFRDSKRIGRSRVTYSSSFAPSSASGAGEIRGESEKEGKGGGRKKVLHLNLAMFH